MHQNFCKISKKNVFQQDFSEKTNNFYFCVTYGHCSRIKEMLCRDGTLRRLKRGVKEISMVFWKKDVFLFSKTERGARTAI